MGQEASKAGGQDAPTFVTLPNDIDLPEATEAAADSSAQTRAVAKVDEGSLDQLPTVPPPGMEASGSAIVRDLGDYRLEKLVLGEGAFGKVRLATSVRTAHRVAVKVIKRKKLNDRAEILLQREVKHHEKLRHENIVRLHTFIMTPNKYYLVMEYCQGGDLLHYINSTPLLSDELARALFCGLMEGIHFCHQIGIHHRDLKLENLMLTSQEERTMSLKIADFGLSDLQTLPSNLSATFCGSPLYAAPELMTAGAAPDGYDASKSDVWSCGVILYALLASALPFDAEDICALVRLIQRGVPNSPVPEERGLAAASLVSLMLTTDPKGRPSAKHVLAQPWAAKPTKGIKASVTTLSLQGERQGAGEHSSAEPAVVPRRRGASATTRFFKEMMLHEKSAKGGGAGRPLGEVDEGCEGVPPTAAVATSAVPDSAPTADSAGGGSGPGQQQQQATAAAVAAATPTPPPPAVMAAGGEAGGDPSKRRQGEVLTRAEMEAIKAKLASGEAVDPDPLPEEDGQEAPPPAAAPSEAPAAEEAVVSEPSRKGGTALTKEEWDEIRRERREEKERARREQEQLQGGAQA